MDTFLLGAYRFLSVLLFLVLSCVLIYHRLFRRWLKFSLGFFVVYVVGGYLFFGKLLIEDWLPSRSNAEALLMSLPYILFYIGTPLLLGFLLFRGHGFLSTVGATLIFSACLGFLLVATTNYFGRPFGFFYEMSAHARAWIEIGSVLLLFVGGLAVVGYCLFSTLTLGQTLGAFLVFLGVASLAMALIQLTIGYEFLGQVVRQVAVLIPALSR